MKELRCNATDGVWRIAFAFDPDRQAILLVGGDKSGGSEKRFYMASCATRSMTGGSCGTESTWCVTLKPAAASAARTRLRNGKRWRFPTSPSISSRSGALSGSTQSLWRTRQAPQAGILWAPTLWMLRRRHFDPEDPRDLGMGALLYLCRKQNLRELDGRAH
jgi:hypothetical protein